ncbi:special sigma factor [Chryseobacterium sp. TY4]
MENNKLRQFVEQIFSEQEKKIAKEKRKNYFKEIGRKGGLKKKTSNQFTRVVSTRLTQKEFEEASQEAKRYNLKFSKFTRLKITDGELRINEFKEHETLLSYGNNFIRIKNLLRHREFSQLDHTKVILREVENVTKLIYDYLYNRMNLRKEADFQEDE